MSQRVTARLFKLHWMLWTLFSLTITVQVHALDTKAQSQVIEINQDLQTTPIYIRNYLSVAQNQAPRLSSSLSPNALKPLNIDLLDFVPKQMPVIHSLEDDQVFRLSLKNASSLDQSLVLNMNSSLFNKVEIYAPNNRVNKHLLTGMALPYETRLVKRPLIIFPIQVPAQTSTEIYIRINSWLQLPFDAYIASNDVHTNTLAQRLSWSHLFVGVLLGVLIYVSTIMTRSRDFKGIKSYALFLGLSLMVLLYCNGYILPYVDFLPNSQSLLMYFYPFLVSGTTVSFCYLIKDFFHTQKTARLTNTLLNAFITCGFILLFLPFFIGVPKTIALLFPFASTVTACVLLITMIFGIKDHAHARLLSFGQVCFLACITLSHLGTEGILNAGLITQHGYELGVCIQSIIFVMVLSNKIKEYQLKASEALLAQAENDAKTQFLAKMSHEIRTPMNGMLGAVEILKFSNPTPDQKKYLNILEGSGKTLTNILDDIIDFTKVSSGKLSLEHIEFNLKDVLEKSVDLMQLNAEQKNLNIELSSDISPDLRIYSDPTRIQQVIVNILNNAIKFTEQGKIEVHAKINHSNIDSPQLNIRINDSGIGIPKDAIENIFDSFSQADPSITRRFGGTGLGLSICKEICELMGGKISCESDALGSTFFIDLPIKLIFDSQRIVSPELLIRKFPGSSVLLVEDNMVNQQILKALIAKFDVSLHCAINGLEAIQYFEQAQESETPFDLILMDCEMPIMDGLSATKRIRQIELEQSLESTAIIAFTAHAIDDYKTKCFEHGMNDYIKKPITFKNLQSIFTQYLSNESTSTSDSPMTETTVNE